MPRTEVYQLRLTKAEKDELANIAKPGSIAQFIRRRCLGQQGHVAEDGVPADIETSIRTDSRETAEASLEPLITQLKGQGMTTPVARREARKRLGL